MYPSTMETGRSTCVGVIKPELYSASLRSMCRHNEWKMNRLKVQVDRAIPPTGKSRVSEDGCPTRSSWEKRGVMFTSADKLTNLGDNRSVGSETESIDSVKGQQPSFCYLCSTMEEHANHHAKTAPRKPKKPRVVYLAPPPIVRRKKETKPPPVFKEALYKLEVYTADKPNASTDAQVHITIEGSEDILPRTKLHKSIGFTKFCFCRGTTESFYVKAPKLGNLETLLIEHDGVEEKHSWCLEKVEVTDMATKDTWIFVCGKWLSLHIKDFKTKRRLKASPKEVTRSEYKIVVHTGKKAFSGTDANVFITLFGQKRNSPKILLKDPSQKCFENGRVDSFQVGLPELGKLNKIRIEHDGKGVAPGWFLDHVVVYNVATPAQKFYCYCNSWLSRDEGDGRLWKILPARNKPRSNGKSQDEDKVKYEVKVLTGDVKYAGTDANVFVQMIGENGATSEIPLDDARNNFERNMVDVFTVRAEDVGCLERILIGHDSSGVGAGWFLEKVTIRRYPRKRKDNSRRRQSTASRSGKGNDQVVRIRNKRNQDFSDLEKSESLGIAEREILSELRAESELIRRNKWVVPEVRRHSDGDFSDWSGSEDNESDSDSTTTRSKRSQNRPVSSYQRRGETGRRHSEARRKSVSIRERPRSGAGGRRSSATQDGRPDSDVDEVESRRKSEQTTPLYEEYVFICHQWLSSDEGDRQTVRELTCQGKTDHFEE